MGSVTDAAVVANECDGVMLVIAANQNSYKFEQKVIADLEKTGCKVLGAILNKVDMSNNKFYGKYYGKYYGHYGQYGDYGQEEAKTGDR